MAINVWGSKTKGFFIYLYIYLFHIHKNVNLSCFQKPLFFLKQLLKSNILFIFCIFSIMSREGENFD